VGAADKAKRKLKDAAGGVRGGVRRRAEERDESQPREARFEPEEVRRRKKPKDDMPQPENFRPQD
jgi:hypothetical protein